MNKKAYRGINALLLNNLDYEYPLYLTFLQVKELGGFIKKGSKSIEVIYWKALWLGNGDKTKRILKQNEPLFSGWKASVISLSLDSLFETSRLPNKQIATT